MTALAPAEFAARERHDDTGVGRARPVGHLH